MQREIKITYLFRNLTKVLTNNFKIDINGISDPLGMYKNVISAQILIYQPVRNFIPYSPEFTSLTLIIPFYTSSDTKILDKNQSEK